jgi:hypothetical protein
MSAPEHLCLTCELAEWKRTKSGRPRPSGDGQCGFTLPHIPIPVTMHWNWGGIANNPEVHGGYINRGYPITACETYAKKEPTP